MKLYTYIWQWQDNEGCDYTVVLLAESHYDAQRRIATRINTIPVRRKTPQDQAIHDWCTTHDATTVIVNPHDMYMEWSEPQ